METSRNNLHRTEVLARAVGRLRRAMVARASRAMERRRAPLVHWQLISAVAFEGLHSQVALSARVALDPARTSRALTRLEKDGLVRRVRSEADRRLVRVNLTPAGRRWYERTRVEVMSELTPVFSSLTPAEARELERLLLKIAPSKLSPS